MRTTGAVTDSLAFTAAPDMLIDQGSQESPNGRARAGFVARMELYARSSRAKRNAGTGGRGADPGLRAKSLCKRFGAPSGLQIPLRFRRRPHVQPSRRMIERPITQSLSCSD